MIDSTVKPRCTRPAVVEHTDDLTCPCLIAGNVCPNHGFWFWHDYFDVARVRKVEAGHP